MDEKQIPSKLQEIIEDFQSSEGREKLELLIQYAEQLPSLPESIDQEKGEMETVPECMTPVQIQAEVQEGKITFFFIVPEESPTVRGFASVMAAGLNGSTPEEIISIPSDFYQLMGLDQVLTTQRLNGISAILSHMKRLAVGALSRDP
jgi:cysteine desulfuration protein SufE